MNWRFLSLFLLIGCLLGTAIATDAHQHHRRHKRHHHDHHRQQLATRHNLVKRAKVDSKCEAPFSGLLTQGLTDASAALKEMITRSENLITFIRSNSRDRPTDRKLLSTLYTYQAIFGRVWYGSDYESNNDYYPEVQQQIDTAKKLIDALGNSESPLWEFYCDDLYLKDEDPWGEEELTQYEYWDSRPDDRQGERVRDLSVLGGACRHNKKDLMAWLTRMDRRNLDTITFCPDALKGFSGTHLSDLKALTRATGTYHIDEVAVSSFGFVLIHELTHSGTVFGRDYYEDPAYSWEGVVSIAQSDDAKKNADSFAFYVAAMYLDANDWSTGFAQAYSDLN